MTGAAAAARRRATFTRGKIAEFKALAFLLAKGYRPVSRRFAAAGGEIDLILMRGDTVVFVEVKARGLMGDALAAITATKHRRFSRAARVWLARHSWAAGKTWRADAVFVAPWRWPRHIVNAFPLQIDQAASRWRS
jgi:putative endonuclease